MNSDYPDIPDREGILPAIDELIAAVTDPDVTLGIETEGYGKCVEAMWRAAYIIHEYVAKQLGVTGFQHGGSSLRLLGKLRRYEGPFMVIDGSEALYPQYDLRGRVDDFLSSANTRKWLAECATALLAANSAFVVGPVADHWRGLVNQGPDPKGQQ